MSDFSFILVTYVKKSISYALLSIVLLVFFVNCSSTNSVKKPQTANDGVTESLKRWKDVDSLLINLDSFPEGEARTAAERQAVEKLWNAIVERNGDEGFATNPSDKVILYLIGDRFDRKRKGLIFALPALVEQNKNNKDQLRFLKEYIEKLTKQFSGIDPSKGKTTTRKANLEIVKSWLEQLNACSHLDGDLVVGILKFQGDWIGDEYTQDKETENYYWTAIDKYEKAINRTHEKRSKIILGSDIAYLCSRYRGKEHKKLISEYKKGLMWSANSLSLLENADGKEWNVVLPRWETRKEGLASLQKAYGENVTGFIYNLYREKRDEDVVLYNRYLDVDFEIEKRFDCYIIVGQSSCRLFRSDIQNKKYRKDCSENARRFFQYTLSLYDGKPPDSYDLS